MKTFREIAKTREELNEIRGLVVNATTSKSIISLPSDFPVRFPLQTHEDIKALENYLQPQDNQNFMVRKHNF